MKAQSQEQKKSAAIRRKRARRSGRRDGDLELLDNAPNRGRTAGSNETLLHLQQTAGNRAVSRLISAGQPTILRQPSADEPVLRFGAQSDAVRMLQHYLVQVGADIAVDGIFGPITHRAVVAFQQANGLDVDGIVGPATWTSLKMGGGKIDADKAGSGKFGQADLFDQTAAKLKAIAMSLRALSGEAAQPSFGTPLGTALGAFGGGLFSSAAKTTVLGLNRAPSASQLRSGQVIMAQPQEGGEKVPPTGTGNQQEEMAAVLGAAADLNQAVAGLSVEAMSGLGPAVVTLQNVVKNVGVDPAANVSATTVSELDAVLADVQVFAANTASGASQTGFTDIKITKDTTYKFKAGDIAGVGQELDNHMSIHGEAAHVSNTPSDNLITDQDTGKVVRAELTYSLERVLPEWTNAAEVGKKCPCWKQEYDRFDGAIKIHEQMHVNIYKKFLAGLHNKCIGLTEQKAREEIDKAEKAVEKLQEEFDTKTDHGQTATPSTKFNAGISCTGCQDNP